MNAERPEDFGSFLTTIYLAMLTKFFVKYIIMFISVKNGMSPFLAKSGDISARNKLITKNNFTLLLPV